MPRVLLLLLQVVSFCGFLLLSACAHDTMDMDMEQGNDQIVGPAPTKDYTQVLPAHQDTGGKKMVLVDPNVHAWGAYAADGHLVKAGIATAGGAICPPDADEADCRTGRGTFHITSIGGEECYSKTYPRPHGGGLMPYCMYFNNGQALHGSPDNIVVENNISHGCVRMRIPDAEWMTKSFAQVGTKVVVVPYEQ